MKKTTIIIALFIGFVITAFQLYSINHQFGQVEILTLIFLAVLIGVIMFLSYERKAKLLNFY
ncbi:hypothetical protein SAMN05661044_00115 [Olivibacter domesticus]|uniref:Uncharacterized protein n=1 Tax=Olivibacter domesticus TaxID=407022 RepID=A0A1H7GPU6_OLID1|nr:hypothetical protein SAMN05661044_00115 [Olivibacter domesticus]